MDFHSTSHTAMGLLTLREGRAPNQAIRRPQVGLDIVSPQATGRGAESITVSTNSSEKHITPSMRALLARLVPAYHPDVVGVSSCFLH